MINKFYLTTAINYTNGFPHIGHAYEIIIADIIARSHRLFNFKVYFLTGSDEHGQKIETTARNNNLQPIELCNNIVNEFMSLNEKLNISNTYYIRTSSNEHEIFCIDFWNKVFEKGDIYKSIYSGYYSVREERYVSENEAASNNYMDPVTNINLIKMTEESYFFKLSRYQSAIIEYINNNSDFIFPLERRNEILKRLCEPLHDISISRQSVGWGIQVPGDIDHVIYVWFDALLNYLSGLCGQYEFLPIDCHLIGKDILWFHAIIWIGMLMSAGYQLPLRILAHGFVNDDVGIKMSKSLGNVINPVELIDSFGADSLRYYCIKTCKIGDDLNYCETNLKSLNDSDLADNYGNLINRTLSLINIKMSGVVRDCDVTGLFDINNLRNILYDMISKYDYCGYVDVVMDNLRLVNKYLTEQKPWIIDDAVVIEEIMKVVIEAIYVLNHFIYPIIPSSATKVFSYIGCMINICDLSWNNLKNITVAADSHILFKRYRKNRK